MEDKYVTFEQAQWLKEKGFDELCQWSFLKEKPVLFGSNNQFESYVSRSEHWQVVDWLLEKRGFWVSVVKADGFQNLFYYTITGSNGFKNGHTIVVEEWDDETCDKMGYNNKYFNSPQEAYSAAFDYIKNNNLI